jgi:hypothetical protein
MAYGLEGPAKKAQQFDYVQYQPQVIVLTLHYPNGVQFGTKMVLPLIGSPDSIVVRSLEGTPYAVTYRLDRRPAPNSAAP